MFIIQKFALVVSLARPKPWWHLKLRTMKNAIAVILIFMFCATARAERKDVSSRQQAVTVYPELGVAGSVFNKRFVEAHNELQKTVPAFFDKPDWPMLLAGAIDSLRRSPGFFDDPQWPVKLAAYVSPGGITHSPSAKASVPPAIEPTARFLEQKALAEKGDRKAQFMTGMYLEEGKEVSKNMAEAVGWYRKSAEQGDPNAQRNLGACYLDGNGLPEDHAEAVRWFRKAAMHGEASAQYLLALCYQRGNGVTKDEVEAARWYHLSASQGHPGAQLSLGLAYLSGDGVPRDYILGYSWVNLAAANGVVAAKDLLPAIEHHLTLDQVAEAQRISREFHPQRGEGAEAGPTASGTGFFITSDGFVLTNAHVVKDGNEFKLMTRAGVIAAHVVKVDPANDIALLKAEGHFAPLPVISSRAVRLGNTVATVGFPDPQLQGFSPKLSKGEIAALSGSSDDARYFQISVPLQPGNSGGALVDERGNVVGIVSAKLNFRTALASSGELPENVNYAVKSSYLLGFLEAVPDVSAKLMETNTKDAKFEDVVKNAEDAAVLVLVY
ncbi:MAG TPA: tetratricopeptide repeat-containing serine protease family protein [Chthoniobacter sp.]|jgi:TPR repeat protein